MFYDIYTVHTHVICNMSFYPRCRHVNTRCQYIALHRPHLQQAFDSCAFGRCTAKSSGVADSGYGALQLWLMRLHNAVSARVLKELKVAAEVDGGRDSDGSEEGGLDSDLSYPPSSTCADCRVAGVWRRGPVLRLMRRTYWDGQGWGHLDLLPLGDREADDEGAGTD